MTERYVGPSAARIADPMPHMVSSDRAGSGRRSPSARASASTRDAARGDALRSLILTRLETLTGLPIWNAYEPVSDAAGKSPMRGRWIRKRT